VSFSSPNSFGTFSTKSTESGPKNLDQVLTLAYTLYDILTERRKKEGKILFESSETVFEFASKTPWSEPSAEKLIPINVKNRSRVAAHRQRRSSTLVRYTRTSFSLTGSWDSAF
jgi:hypothetical protein